MRQKTMNYECDFAETYEPLENYDKALGKFILSVLFGLVLGVVSILQFGSAVGTIYNCSADSTMLGCWHFNDFNSTTNMSSDGSSNNNNVTAINGTFFNSTGGFFRDGAFEFNGSAVNWLNTSQPIFRNFTTRNYTIGFWVKHDLVTSNVATDSQTFFNSGTGTVFNNTWIVLRNSVYQFRLQTSLQDTTRTATQINNTWVYLTAVYNGTNMSLYVNGNPQSSATITYPKAILQTANEMLTIGRAIGNANLNGSLDEFMVWNRSLSSQEIQQNYNNYVGCLDPTSSFSLISNANLCGNTYNINLTANQKAIQLNENNLIFDCNGSTIFGNLSTGDIGIFTSKNNVTIKNCIVHDYTKGVNVQGNNTLINNITGWGTQSSGNTGSIYISGSWNSIVTNNNITAKTLTNNGIFIDTFSNNFTVNNNYVSSTNIGIRLYTTSNVIVFNNTFSNNTRDVYVEERNYNTTITNNTANMNTFFVSSNTGFSGTNIIQDNLTITNNFVNGSDIFTTLTNFTNVLITNNNVNYSRFFKQSEITQNITISNNILYGYKGTTAYHIIFTANAGSLKLNINITNNTVNNGGSGGISFTNANYSNVNIVSNRFYNNTVSATNNAPFVNLNSVPGGTFNIYNNVFNRTTSHLAFYKNNASIDIENNIIDDASQNGDSYNVGIQISHGNNIVIKNNSLTRIGCVGVLIQGGDNIAILNNSIGFDLQSNYNEASNCAYEPITAIHDYGIWKTWATDSTELGSDNVTKIRTYDSNNLTILGNNITGFYVLLRISEPTNLTHDLTNYWFRSLSLMDYLEPRVDWYISNSYENASTTFNVTNGNPVTLRTTLGQRYPGFSTSTPYMTYELHDSYIYFNNTNGTTTFNIDLFNQSNTLAFILNGNASCTSLQDCDGNFNITNIQGYQAGYILPEFNLTENINRKNSPIWISSKTATSSTITYHIASNLTNTISGIQFYPNNIVCPLFISYVSNTSAVQQSSNFSCSGGIVSNVTLNNLEPASGSNTLTFNYQTSPGGNSGSSSSLYYQYNQSIICSNVYYFLIDHTLTNGSISYTPTDLSNLASEITAEIHTLINPSTIQPYVNDFSLCANYTSLRLPTRASLNLSILNLPGTSFNPQQCSPELNSTFLGYNMDTSLPFFKIYSGDWSCDSLEKWRWLFEISEDQQGYAITGVKAWFLILGLLGWMIVSFARSNGLMNHAIKKMFGDGKRR